MVPSTFTVLNLADSGDGSLRAAVQAAEASPGPDEIDFAPGVRGTISLTRGELFITDDLTINGPGADVLTVSGNDASRAFDVAGGADESTRIAVRISGLIVSHGRELEGAGIRNTAFSDLTLSHVTLSNNQSSGLAGSSSTGGAVTNTGAGAILDVVASQVIDNTVDGSAGLSAVGGGVFSDGTGVNIRDSAIAGNEVLAGYGDGEFGGGAGGGGVYVENSSLTVTNSFIANNRTEGRTSDGAGIAVATDSNTQIGSPVIRNSLITGNEAVGIGRAAPDFGHEGRAEGGGIYNFNQSVTITGSVLRGNRAVGGLDLAGEARGGAIAQFLSPLAVLVISNCQLSDNEAVSGDGGTVGEADGGAIYNLLDGRVLISDSTLENNRAVGGRGANLLGGAIGGAIANLADSHLEITRCTLRGNQAIGSSFVAADPFHFDAGSAHGGAIYNHQGSEAIVRDSAFINNQAIGGSFNSSSNSSGLTGFFTGTATGGAIDNDGTDTLNTDQPCRLTVTGSIIRQNKAIGGRSNTGDSGGHILFVGAGLGGGIANYLGGTTTIGSSVVSGNQALGGGENDRVDGVVSPNLGAGGGIFNALGGLTDFGQVGPSIVNIGNNSRLAGNQAQGGEGLPVLRGGYGLGGGVAGLFGATTGVTGSSLTANVAAGGGSLAVDGGNGLGGGAYNDDSSTLALATSVVTRNQALGGLAGFGGSPGQGIGGGIYNLGRLAIDVVSLVLGNFASTSNNDIFG
jgi:hypothetical protein